MCNELQGFLEVFFGGGNREWLGGGVAAVRAEEAIFWGEEWLVLGGRLPLKGPKLLKKA